MLEIVELVFWSKIGLFQTNSDHDVYMDDPQYKDPKWPSYG